MQISNKIENLDEISISIIYKLDKLFVFSWSWFALM
jgi:hypothetical protein